MLKTIRMVAWGAVALLAAAAGYVALTGGPGALRGIQPPLSAAVGGPFSLTTHEGKTLSSSELVGKPFAIFFGFTYCPEICPTTLLDTSNLIRALGPDADKMRYLFVSVDPERDTPDQLKLYLSSFDPHITGLTGSLSDVADAARKYRVLFEKAPTKEGYTINHTATTYLMDAKGGFVGTLDYQEKSDAALAKLRRLIAAVK